MSRLTCVRHLDALLSVKLQQRIQQSRGIFFANLAAKASPLMLESHPQTGGSYSIVQETLHIIFLMFPSFLHIILGSSSSCSFADVEAEKSRISCRCNCRAPRQTAVAHFTARFGVCTPANCSAHVRWRPSVEVLQLSTCYPHVCKSAHPATADLHPHPVLCIHFCFQVAATFFQRV